MEKFKIIHFIGEGGTSKVYSAIDKSTNQKVAIKIIDKQKHMLSARNEILINKKLSHKHVVRMIEYHETGTRFYLIFEYMDSLAFKVGLFARNAAKIVRMILIAIEYIHSEGIMHRDIKLSNLYVRDGVVKIGDFGLACDVKVHHTYCGTIPFLAPEVVKREYDQSIDVYGLGVIMKMVLRENKTIISDKDAYVDLMNMFLRCSKNRISAKDALKHRFFRSLYPKVPYFCDIPDFQRNTKFGIIRKIGSSINFVYDENMYQIEIKDSNEKICGHKTEFLSNAKDNSFERENMLNMGDVGSKFKINGRQLSEFIKNINNRPETCVFCNKPIKNYTPYFSINENTVDIFSIDNEALKTFSFMSEIIYIVRKHSKKIVLSDQNVVFTLFADHTFEVRVNGRSIFEKGDLASFEASFNSRSKENCVLFTDSGNLETFDKNKKFSRKHPNFENRIVNKISELKEILFYIEKSINWCNCIIPLKCNITINYTDPYSHESVKSQDHPMSSQFNKLGGMTAEIDNIPLFSTQICTSWQYIFYKDIWIVKNKLYFNFLLVTGVRVEVDGYKLEYIITPSNDAEIDYGYIYENVIEILEYILKEI